MRGPRPGTAIALLALFVALGGTGYAALGGSSIPDRNGQFHACVNRKSGALRIVAAGKCKKRELAISWSQTGPQGPRGAQGDAGAQGSPGQPGAAAPSLLPPGGSESGIFSDVGGKEDNPREAVTFPTPLATAPAHVALIKFNAPTTANCPGPGAAAAGWLCLYETQSGSYTNASIYDTTSTGGADPLGFILVLTNAGAAAFSQGIWTVTAG